MCRMEAVMASELAQLESRTISTSQVEAKQENEDVDFEFNGNSHHIQNRQRPPETPMQTRRTFSSRILRPRTKGKEQAVTKSTIPSQNDISRKKSGGLLAYVSPTAIRLKI
jgi:hypothetical protein